MYKQPNIDVSKRGIAKHCMLVFILAFLKLSTLSSAAALEYGPLANIEIAPVEAQQYATGPHIEVYLLSNKTALVPGEQIELGVLFKPEALWHTYWRNPGDSGEAPTISWQSEATLNFGEIQWPLPSAIPIAHLVNYGYEGSNLLIVPVDVPFDLSKNIDPQALDNEQNLTISADISWLVCKEDCIPGWTTLSLQLPMSNSAEPSAHAALFEQTSLLWPNADSKQGRFEITDHDIVFEISEVSSKQWQLFAFRSDVVNHAAPQTLIQDETTTRIIVPRSDYFDGNAERLNWLISNGTEGYYVEGSLNDTVSANSSKTAKFKQLPVSELLVFMLMAFVGGLILNLMPCVLPILSIKAMALQSTAHSLMHKLAYLFGVVFCFNLFALVIVALQQTGQQVGWGFHMQEPVIVALLAFLFTLIALVLLDALAVSSRLSNIGQGLVSGDSASAHFATGMLAVIVASPCTAPFMAAALGIALVSEPLVSFLLFNALALGFALPLTLLFISSKAMSLLPKPGAWMETFKHFLAFPMFATVAWLCWVFAGQLGAQAQFVLLIALILFCMFVWLLGRSKSFVGKSMNTLGIVLSLALPIWLSLSGQAYVSETSTASTASASNSKALPYVDFSEQRLQQLRADDYVVVVNMTADWCITCKVNEQVAFANDDVRDALKQDKVRYMVGDWTNKNTEILNYLSQYERAGVPLYVVYAGLQNKQVLPQILTPNTVTNAIDQAKEELQNVKQQ